MRMNNFVLKQSIALVFVSGSILFSVGYFLPNEVALQGATLAASVIGYIIYLRVRNWEIKDEVHKDFLLFVITLVMSLWASLCLITTCVISAKLPLCLANRRNSFVILYFFFPLLVVFFSWLSTRLSPSK
jgi:hypothetical protein